MLFSLGFSIIILILCSFGIVAIVLSSILKRKIEFGIRYSIGASPKNIMTLIIGEILLMFILGDIIGTILTYVISINIDTVKIGCLTIFPTTLIMFIFSFLSSLIPAIKIINMEPIKLIRGERV